jgi:glutathione synthase
VKHAFIMDPLERVKAHKDTSYFLMLAADQRGHEVFYLNAVDLALDHDRVMASLQRLRVNDNVDNPFAVEPARWQALDEMDVVWIRSDPPVDRSYIYTTLLLDLLPERVRVVNRPSTIRDWNEKLVALRYPDWTPRTIVSRDSGRIRIFAEKFSRVTIKPIDGHGGSGIIFVTAADSDFDSTINEATRQGRHWVIVQEYLEAAHDGDKRILLLEGQPLGAILRLHADGVELNNLDQGGTAVASSLTERDHVICQALGDDLRAYGVVFAGIDVIGGMLIEVNITSPTGLQEMTRFDGRLYHEEIITSLE